MKNTRPAIQPQTVGIILGTERFDQCVDFYKTKLGLPVWFEKEHLVCLHFGSGYLMIETGGVARESRKSSDENPTMLRFNVVDVESSAANLRELGIDVNLKYFDWGTVATFIDPDGNACELKDSEDPFFN